MDGHSLEVPDHIDFKAQLLGTQMQAIGFLALYYLFWMFVSHYWPEFFRPTQWSQGVQGSLFDSVCRFQWLFVYAACMALISLGNLLPAFRTGASDEGHLALDTITSVFAGVWEELGFRCLFILGAMIAIVLSNLFWFWFVILTALICFILLLNIAVHEESALAVVLGLFAALFFGGVLYWTWNLKDPVYWCYQHITFPILSWASFRTLDPVLYYDGAPFLFIAAAVSVNAKFRDGHKYQGFFGMVNAWVVGFILLYAMLYYGLMTAIVVHAIYDLEFAAIRYIGRKVDRLQEG
jgi:hypothetical protein